VGGPIFLISGTTHASFETSSDTMGGVELKIQKGVGPGMAVYNEFQYKARTNQCLLCIRFQGVSGILRW
jgi:hypothetical protein